MNLVFTGISVQVSLMEKSKLLIMVAVFVPFPIIWLRNLSTIAFLSASGIIMSAFIFLTVTGTTISGAVKANHRIPGLQLNRIPHVSGLYTFSYAGHIVFHYIYTSMKDLSKYKKVDSTIHFIKSQ